jgi:hypothetical protein
MAEQNKQHGHGGDFSSSVHVFTLRCGILPARLDSGNQHPAHGTGELDSAEGQA